MCRRDQVWLAACLVLLLGFLGMQSGLRLLHWQFEKEKLPLRKPFTALPHSAGDYELLSELSEFPAEIERTLGADGYITRIYRDARFAKTEPGGLIRVHLAYYSGTTDTTIWHRPEVCYVAAGAEARGLRSTELWVPERVDAQYFEFLPPGRNRPEGVVYFFVANGRLSGSTTGVRLLDLRLRDRFSYWCKVEVHVPGLGREVLIRQTIEPFLQAVLPQIFECLPVWQSGADDE
jgi:hypothetical protein